jgi:hypothetical protein
MANYAYVHRQTVGFRLFKEAGPDGAPPGNRRFAYCVDVRDVDQFYGELKPKLRIAFARRCAWPADKPYWQCELLSDGNLIAFGHAIGRRETTS